MFDVSKIEAEARKQISDEKSARAKAALTAALRKLDVAEQVVRNVKAEIEDLKASITDGSFTA
jgi:hypothetical protein